MKNRVYLSSVRYEGFVIEYEQMTQGLMLIETCGHRSWFDENRQIVYVHSLATAPWNRPTLQKPVKYRSIGSTLLQFARFRSEELGYGGLVGLHALPDADPFYRKMNMNDCGRDEAKENLTYFEWYSRRPSLLDEVDF
ncbi:GNAT family N-acetyltransferase [Scytonema hofmannii]|uniref:GNAT family N-acetyltransferase n=1 Tax=Scytonema hofmannii TaxID=34078 RepID=UPI0003828F3F|nr:GNAT family N-acetyltransferase [Scytonema hofmannii]